MGKNKKQQSRRAPPKTAPDKPAAERPPVPSGGGMGKGWLAALLAVTFAIAFGLAWFIFAPRGEGQPKTPPPQPAKTISEADIAAFLAAVDTEEYAAIARIGGELFQPGCLVPDQERLFGEHLVSKDPPYLVYNFYSKSDEDRVYRVYLTIDEDHKVDSFMAEDMPVAK